MQNIYDLPRLSGIYSIRNLVSGNRYIGSTSNIRRRIIEHRSQLQRSAHYNFILQRAWDKYGPTAFTVDVLVLCSTDDLIVYEQEYMDKYRPKYNLSTLAAGKIPTENTKQKAWNSRWGLTSPKERKEFMKHLRQVSEEKRELWCNEEYRRNIGEQSRQRWKTESYREKFSVGQRFSHGKFSVGDIIVIRRLYYIENMFICDIARRMMHDPTNIYNAIFTNYKYVDDGIDPEIKSKKLHGRKFTKVYDPRSAKFTAKFVEKVDQAIIQGKSRKDICSEFSVSTRYISKRKKIIQDENKNKN